MRRYFNHGKMEAEPVKGRGSWVLAADAAKLATALKEACDNLVASADYNGCAADVARYDALLAEWEDET